MPGAECENEQEMNKSACSLEFTVPEVDPDIFYPITVSFTSRQTYADVQVL